MKFLVLSRREIKKFETTEKHMIISIADPEVDYVTLIKQKSTIGTLFIRFPDLDKEAEGYEFNDLLFSQKHAKAIWKFFQEFKDKVDLVVCQCEAGISRSSAVAGALSKATGQDDTPFFKKYLPNRLVYRLILEEGLK